MKTRKHEQTAICREDLERLRNFKLNSHAGLTQIMIIKQALDLWEKKYSK